MAKRQTATVEVAFDVEHIQTLLERSLAERVEQQFGASFDKFIQAAVRERLDALTHKRIEQAVEIALAEGWQRTNSYGEPTGVKMTLKERISEQFTQKISGYGSDSETRVDKMIRTTVEQALSKEFRTELESAKTRFKSLLDGTIAAKFAETLKSSLGLR